MCVGNNSAHLTGAEQRSSFLTNLTGHLLVCVAACLQLELFRVNTSSSVFAALTGCE
jgi:hypothetical protein